MENENGRCYCSWLNRTFDVYFGLPYCVPVLLFARSSVYSSIHFCYTFYLYWQIDRFHLNVTSMTIDFFLFRIFSVWDEWYANWMAYVNKMRSKIDFCRITNVILYPSLSPSHACLLDRSMNACIKIKLIKKVCVLCVMALIHVKKRRSQTYHWSFVINSMCARYALKKHQHHQ